MCTLIVKVRLALFSALDGKEYQKADNCDHYHSDTDTDAGLGSRA